MEGSSLSMSIRIRRDRLCELLQRHSMKKRKIILMDTRGVTLIGVLVSALILSVGILALVRIFSATPRINASTERISRSTNLAQDKIEEFRALGYDSLESLINASATTGVDTSGFIIREYGLAFDTLNTIRIEIRCFGQSAVWGGEVKVVTLLSRHD